MTTREEFEAWLRNETDKGYFWEYESALAGFEASRTAALEEAAKLCDGKASEYDLDFEPRMNIAAERCAVGIRALKDAP